MIKNVSQIETKVVLRQLRETLAILDRIPELASAGARLSTVIIQVEEWSADQMMTDQDRSDDCTRR